MTIFLTLGGHVACTQCNARSSPQPLQSNVYPLALKPDSLPPKIPKMAIIRPHPRGYPHLLRKVPLIASTYYSGLEIWCFLGKLK